MSNKYDYNKLREELDETDQAVQKQGQEINKLQTELKEMGEKLKVVKEKCLNMQRRLNASSSEDSDDKYERSLGGISGDLDHVGYGDSDKPIGGLSEY